MSTKRNCARCKKPFWSRSYCSHCEQLTAKRRNAALRKRKKDETVSRLPGANFPPISLGEVGGPPPKPEVWIATGLGDGPEGVWTKVVVE
jgi:hypothetical protein